MAVVILMCYFFSSWFMIAVACGLRILSLNCHGFNTGTAHYLNRVAKEVDLYSYKKPGYVMQQPVG